MKVFVTGATGFVGRHLVPELLARGHEVMVLARSPERVEKFAWCGDVKILPFDLHAENYPQMECSDGQAIVHLAWGQLTQYDSAEHLEKNFPDSLRFLRHAIEQGVTRVVVTGTCFEYGLTEGCLHEDIQAQPVLPYAIAKNELRKQLFLIDRRDNVIVNWVRLFYMYGEGQNPASLLAALDRCIDEGAPVFNMSPGDQLRDYLPVEKVASKLVSILERPIGDKILNCCLGRPVSVMELIQQRLRERGANIKLNRGYYGYSKHEPLHFWGDSRRLERILETQPMQDSPNCQ